MNQSKSDRPQVLLVNRCFIVNSKNQFLLIKRSSTDSHNAGLWEVPGGKLDNGQDLSQALRREVAEETGLYINPSFELVNANSSILTRGKYAGLPYVVLFGIAHSFTGKLKLSHEHEDSAWVSTIDALNYDLTIETKKALKALQKHLGSS